MLSLQIGLVEQYKKEYNKPYKSVRLFQKREIVLLLRRLETDKR